MITANSISAQEEAALSTYLRFLQERFGPELLDVIMYGSKARGDAAPDSDVDVIVILDQPTAQDLSDARGLVFDILLNTEVLLSVRVLSRRDWDALATMQSLFYRNVLRDGISLLTGTDQLVARRIDRSSPSRH